MQEGFGLDIGRIMAVVSPTAVWWYVDSDLRTNARGAAADGDLRRSRTGAPTERQNTPGRPGALRS